MSIRNLALKEGPKSEDTPASSGTTNACKFDLELRKSYAVAGAAAKLVAP